MVEFYREGSAPAASATGLFSRASIFYRLSTCWRPDQKAYPDLSSLNAMDTETIGSRRFPEVFPEILEVLTRIQVIKLIKGFVNLENQPKFL